MSANTSSSNAAKRGLFRPPLILLCSILLGVSLRFAMPQRFAPASLATPVGVRQIHVLQQANKAIDEVRRAEFFRKGGRMRGVVKGKRWLLLTRWDAGATCVWRFRH